MEITCKKCGAKLSIPDGRVPIGQRLSASCPKCKGTIFIEGPEGKPKNRTPEPENKAMGPGGEKTTGYEYGDDDSALDVYEEGARLALFMENPSDEIEKVKRGVEELGYRVVSAANTREAIGKMRFHHFDLAVLSDRFDNVELSQNPVIHYLNHLSMSIRRRMFLALVGDAFKTMDEMMAFAMSANVVVNRKDLDKLKGILKKAIVDNKGFYKVFMDTLPEVGRA